MHDISALIAQLEALHNHVCPRQILGIRMGILAAEMLDLDLPQKNKRLYAFVETDGCFADGVMVATGCSLGHRTMHLMDYGKVAATFVDTKTGRAVRIAPNALSRERAAALMPDAKSRWHAQLEAYQTMPCEDLLQAREVALTVSLEALISRPGVRVTCSHCGEEILNEREMIVAGEVVCQSCAGNSYWSDGTSALIAHAEEAGTAS